MVENLVLEDVFWALFAPHYDKVKLMANLERAEKTNDLEDSKEMDIKSMMEPETVEHRKTCGYSMTIYDHYADNVMFPKYTTRI